MAEKLFSCGKHSSADCDSLMVGDRDLLLKADGFLCTAKLIVKLYRNEGCDRAILLALHLDVYLGNTFTGKFSLSEG